MLIRNEHGHFQAISIPVGSFVLFTQGTRLPAPGLLEMLPEHPDTTWGCEHYRVMGVAPRTVPHGSSLWRVRADKTLQLIEDNHDSSD
jgi:hypothetical protein